LAGQEFHRRNTVIVADDPRDRGQFEMKGWLLKKATTTYLGMANWQRRYLWLKDDKLYFYDEESEVEQ